MKTEDAVRAEKYIRYVAKWIDASNRHSVEAEDLQQVGRVAAWRAELTYTGQPDSILWYVMASARNAMTNYAVKCSQYRCHCVGMDVSSVSGADEAEAVVDKVTAEQFTASLTGAERQILRRAMSGKAENEIERRRLLVAMRLLQDKYIAFCNENKENGGVYASENYILCSYNIPCNTYRKRDFPLSYPQFFDGEFSHISERLTGNFHTY